MGRNRAAQRSGFHQVDIISSWRWFDRATARKPGEFSPAERHSSWDAFMCEGCHATRFEMIARFGLKCSKCGNKISQNSESVLLM
jgi:hypothetical protein